MSLAGYQFALRQTTIQGGAPPGPDPLPFDETLNAAVGFWLNQNSWTDGTNVLTTNGANVTVVKSAIADGVDGTLVGTAGTVSIETDGTRALQLSGSGYYSFGEQSVLDFSGNDEFTVVAWLGDSVPSTGSAMLAKAGSTSSQRQYFLLYGTGVIYMQTGNNPQATNTTVSAQDVLYWICDGSIQSKRINNVLANSRTSGEFLNAIDVRFGARSANDTAQGGIAAGNNGSIREVFKFNRILTESEFTQVQTYFNNK